MDAGSSQFFHWREKFGRVHIETIKHPDDEMILDVFFPVTRLDNVKFEIPFDRAAKFSGAMEDLTEHEFEMWSQVK